MGKWLYTRLRLESATVGKLAENWPGVRVLWWGAKLFIYLLFVCLFVWFFPSTSTLFECKGVQSFTSLEISAEARVLVCEKDLVCWLGKALLVNLFIWSSLFFLTCKREVLKEHSTSTYMVLTVCPPLCQDDGWYRDRQDEMKAFNLYNCCHALWFCFKLPLLLF